jgi:GNAT superfamily N-acetyltransferase
MKITEVSRFSIRVYNAVIKLLPQLSEGTELPSREHIKAILKSCGTHLFIAELDDNQIIGMMTISTYGIPTGTKVWIEDVVVDDSQRGKGFGKELIMFAIDYARSIDAKTIDLTSKPSRIAANRLYQMSGFVLRKTNVYRYTLK